MPIRCEIVSQDRLVYEGEADMVVVPGAGGEMGILPNHAPLLSALKYGLLRVRAHGNEEVFTVAGGVVEVLPDRVTVMADAAENVAEIDVARAEQARKRVEDLLQQGVPRDSDDFLALEAAMRRSNLRIEAARRYRSHRAKTSGDYSGGEA
ncbi:MAG: ATP synthase F1 subunit epsilon [Chloroflexota bacterium]